MRPERPRAFAMAGAHAHAGTAQALRISSAERPILSPALLDNGLQVGLFYTFAPRLMPWPCPAPAESFQALEAFSKCPQSLLQKAPSFPVETVQL